MGPGGHAERTGDVIMIDDTNRNADQGQPGRPDVKKAFQNLPIVWLVPIVALIIGGWLLWRDAASKGPEITVTFMTAEGLTAGKTAVRYRDVDVGQVTSINLSDDFEHVVLTMRMNADFDPYLTDKTKFWVVRPRVSAQGISGLQTIVSGAYIEVVPDKTGKKARKFAGSEEPEYVPDGSDGTRFILMADELGSVAVGTPVLLRGVEVGEVLDTNLDMAAERVSIPIYVRKPFDVLVKKDTRFWNSSGISLDLSAEGVSVRAQSVRSVLAGGINFYTPEESLQSETAKSDTLFRLHDNRKQAEILAHGITQKFVLYFDSSVRGLSPGAPVEFNGIRVGTVNSVNLEYVIANQSFRVPVEVTLEPERVQMVGGNDADGDEYDRIMGTLVDRGMRARLKTGSFITGQLFVDLGMYPVTPPRYLGDEKGKIPELPTLPQKIDEISNSLTSLLEKVETFPIEEIGIRLLGTVEGMENIVTSPAITEGMNSLKQAAAGVSQLVTNLDTSVLPATQNALEAAQAALGGVRDVTSPNSPIRYNFEETLKELSAAARSLRDLADFLEQNPNALILGKPGRREEE